MPSGASTSAARVSTRCRSAPPRSVPGSTRTRASARRPSQRLAAATGTAAAAGRAPRRGAGRARRDGGDERGAPRAGRGAVQDRQRRAAVCLRARRRPGRAGAAGQRARLFDHAGQGEPEPVRGDDHGGAAGLRPRHRGGVCQRPGAAAAQRLQAADPARRPAVGAAARRRVRCVHAVLHRGPAAGSRPHRGAPARVADAGHGAGAAHRLLARRRDRHRPRIATGSRCARRRWPRATSAAADFDRWVRPDAMARPHGAPAGRGRDRLPPGPLGGDGGSLHRRVRMAALRYTSDAEPGITRLRRGRGFVYRWPDRRPLRDPATLARIRRLAIPPAWTEVWISPRAERPHPGHRPRPARAQAASLSSPLDGGARRGQVRAACSTSAGPCRRCAGRCDATWPGRGCRTARWSRSWCSCWRRR